MTGAVRHRYLVCYDVREPKRLRKTHEAMLGYGDPIQYSVFICDLSGSERLLMEEALRRVARLSEDSVHIVDLGPARGRTLARVRNLGGTAPPAPRRYTVL